MRHDRAIPLAVMAGLDPAIHARTAAQAVPLELRVLPVRATRRHDVDGRIKSGHDGLF
jgi:hypothetical protein